MNRESIKVVIVDDEPIARDILEAYLAGNHNFSIVARCKNAVEAFKALSVYETDLLLLDINMPEISGVDLIKSLKKTPLVIFTTAYSDYAVESYELDKVVDYLLKPISAERFNKALDKAYKILRPLAGTEEEPVKMPAVEQERQMFVRSEGKWIRIDITALLYIEGLKDYVKIYTSDGKVIVRSTMKNFEEQLAGYSNFLRVHKSFIINMDFITEADSNFVKIKDQLISIGNTHKEEVMRLLNSYRMH